MMREGGRLAVFLLLVGTAGVAAGVEELRLSMEELEGEDWRGRGLVVDVADNGNGSFSLALTLARLIVGDAEFKDIHLGCAAAVPGDSGGVSCGNGEPPVEAAACGY